MIALALIVLIVTMTAAVLFGTALGQGARWYAAPLGLGVLVGLAFLLAIAASVTW
ncbi:hypothetical protein [Microbacterium sp. IEGM 1404]|uniref:hypothetical protein n=1 Tax=Microbacterium sp. IEGM 1404 TaxID=3047084 RepID=UPI0024B68985|nr:hypothetical protein [Microbacterium sp. IEGM 1404]MDI9889942.1 hypothetical protein [Microbacterium sp. IEGM 1404]